MLMNINAGARINIIRDTIQFPFSRIILGRKYEWRSLQKKDIWRNEQQTTKRMWVYTNEAFFILSVLILAEYFLTQQTETRICDSLIWRLTVVWCH